YWSEPQLAVAEYLAKYSGLDRVFFCNSGAEANEGAIKLARKYFYDKGEDRFEIITMNKSFHGRTLATLTATGQDKVKTGFYPLPDGFVYADFNDFESVKSTVTPQTAAIMMEPVQGEGGIYPMEPDFIRQVAELCNENGLLLIFDEIQCGMGRTGTMFCYEQYGIAPDIVTNAKALGGGLPFGAIIAKEDVAASFGPGAHGSTFGGNPVAAAASAAVFRTMEEEHILANVNSVSAYFFHALNGLKEEFPQIIIDVRGKGLLIGMEVTIPALTIVNACLEQGLILLNAGPNVVRFLPPLNICEKDVDFVTETLKKVLKTL
ncbi:MAG: acetylornithine transaminase, partial [Firmicutes bacterium]|nr:acetylornithine transaminase [Bacillota bacterium]